MLATGLHVIGCRFLMYSYYVQYVETMHTTVTDQVGHSIRVIAQLLGSRKFYSYTLLLPNALRLGIHCHKSLAPVP